jgi:hypothetical protein
MQARCLLSSISRRVVASITVQPGVVSSLHDNQASCSLVMEHLNFHFHYGKGYIFQDRESIIDSA